MAKQILSKLAGPDYKCPACGQGLRVETVPDGLYLFCGYYKCPCMDLNDGAKGESYEEAYRKLENIYKSQPQA